MPTGFEIRFVPYTPGGAKLSPKLSHAGGNFQKPFCDTATLTGLSVPAVVAGALPTMLEVAAEYNAGSGWIEMRGGRFLVNNVVGEDTDPTAMQTLSGIGIWEWFLQRAYLNHVAATKATGLNSEPDLVLNSVTSAGTTFTKTSHGLHLGDITKLTVPGGIKTLKKNGYYYVTNVTTNTFQVSTTATGAARSVGTHSGIQITRAHVKVVKTGQPFVDGEKVTVLATGGATGVTVGQDYYVVRSTSNSLALSSTVNGPNINLSSATGMSLAAAPDGDRRFNGVTPGKIMKTFIDEAVARGALSPAGVPLTYDFTATTDSNGVAWASTYTIGIGPGTTGLAVLQILTKNAWAEYDTTARVLHLYNRGSGTDQTTGGDPVTIGQSALSRPMQLSLDNLLTDVVTADENGKLTAAYSATGALPLGRLESYQTQAGVSDDGTSAAIVATYAEQNAAPQQAWTVTESALKAAKLPEVSYINGDKIRAPFGGQFVSQNVVQIAYRIDQNGALSIDTTLGYRFVNLQAKVARRLVGLFGNRVDTGTGKTILPWINAAQPAPPGSLTVGSDGAFAGSGSAKADLTVSWDPVAATSSGDQVTVTDYEVFVRADGADTPISQGKTSGATSYTVQGADANTIVAVSVRAINSAGAAGPLSDELEVVSGVPDVVLEQPSAPTLSSDTKGDVSIGWDGFILGDTPSPDFAFVRAEISADGVSGWSPAGSQLSAAGTTIVQDVGAGTWYFQLVPVDNLGRSGAPSDVASQLVAPVVADTRVPKAPTDLAVTSAGLWSGSEPTANITASWTAVTEATDSSAMDMIAYELWGKVSSDTEFALLTSVGGAATSVTYNDIGPLGSDWDFELRATGSNVVQSDFSDEATATIAVPGLALDPPTAPDLDTYRGLLLVSWDGNLVDSSDNAYTAPAYLANVDIWVSVDAGTTYTRMGFLQAGTRTQSVSGLGVGADVLVTLVAVDRVGNATDPSASAEVVITGIDGADLLADTVNANALIAGTLNVDKVSPSFGNDLDLTANDAVTILAGSVATAQDTADGTAADLADMQTRYSFTSTAAVISQPGSAFSVSISNTELDFLEAGVARAYLNAGVFYAPKLSSTEIALTHHLIEDDPAGAGTIVKRF